MKISNVLTTLTAAEGSVTNVTETRGPVGTIWVETAAGVHTSVRLGQDLLLIGREHAWIAIPVGEIITLAKTHNALVASAVTASTVNSTTTSSAVNTAA
jgi:hypothetical protein